MSSSPHHTLSACLNYVVEKLFLLLSFFVFLSHRRGKETNKMRKKEEKETEGREWDWDRENDCKNEQSRTCKWWPMATGTEALFTSGHSVLWPILRWITAGIFGEISHSIKSKKIWGHLLVNVPTTINEKK